MSEQFEHPGKWFMLMRKSGELQRIQDQTTRLKTSEPSEYESLWRERVFNDVCLISDLEQAEEA